VHVEPYRLDPGRYPLKVRILAATGGRGPALGHIIMWPSRSTNEEARRLATMMVMGGKRIPRLTRAASLIAHQSIDYLREATYPARATKSASACCASGARRNRYGMAFQDGASSAYPEAVLVYADATVRRRCRTSTASRLGGLADRRALRNDAMRDRFALRLILLGLAVSWRWRCGASWPDVGAWFAPVKRTGYAGRRAPVIARGDLASDELSTIGAWFERCARPRSVFNRYVVPAGTGYSGTDNTVFSVPGTVLGGGVRAAGGITVAGFDLG